MVGRWLPRDVARGTVRPVAPMLFFSDMPIRLPPQVLAMASAPAASRDGRGSWRLGYCLPRRPALSPALKAAIMHAPKAKTTPTGTRMDPGVPGLSAMLAG